MNINTKHLRWTTLERGEQKKYKGKSKIKFGAKPFHPPTYFLRARLSEKLVLMDEIFACLLDLKVVEYTQLTCKTYFYQAEIFGPLYKRKIEIVPVR
jgi:hypothetical protein